MNSLPIGIFDSGVGGLTVLRELRRLLGDRLGLGKSALVDEHVVLLDQHRQPLVHLDPLGAFAVDLRFDRRVSLVECDLRPTFARRLLNIASRTFDAPFELAAGVGRNLLPLYLGGDLVEDRHGLRGGFLGDALRLELPGGDFRRQLGDDEIGRHGLCR